MKTIEINHVSEFVKAVVESRQEHFYHGVAHFQVVYRGHSKTGWPLLPAAFRSTDDFLNERLYLQEFQREMPNETLGLCNFDVLVKAQHYGIPTRLLDFTLNPLVALYFACCNNNDSDAEVFEIDPVSLFSQDDILFHIIIDYVLNFKNGQHWDHNYIARLCNSLDYKTVGRFGFSDSQLQKTVLDILSNPKFPYFVLPRLTNPRIRAQQGAFALFHTPLEYKVNEAKQHIQYFRLPSESTFPSLIPKTSFFINHKNKTSILTELDCIGINESTLFPELENHSKDIVRRIRNSNSALNQRIIKK